MNKKLDPDLKAVQREEAKKWVRGMTCTFGKGRVFHEPAGQRDTRIQRRYYLDPNYHINYQDRYLIRLKWPGFHRNRWRPSFELYLYKAGEMDKPFFEKEFLEGTTIDEVLSFMTTESDFTNHLTMFLFEKRG